MEKTYKIICIDNNKEKVIATAITKSEIRKQFNAIYKLFNDCGRIVKQDNSYFTRYIGAAKIEYKIVEC